jgi:hypothetical protein
MEVCTVLGSSTGTVIEITREVRRGISSKIGCWEEDVLGGVQNRHNVDSIAVLYVDVVRIHVQVNGSSKYFQEHLVE